MYREPLDRSPNPMHTGVNRPRPTAKNGIDLLISCPYCFRPRDALCERVQVNRNQAVMRDDTLPLSDALTLHAAWMDDPQVEFGVKLRHTEDLFREALSPFAY